MAVKINFTQVIAAEGEQKASRALREASDVIAKSSSALQLRYLQVGLSEPVLIYLIKIPPLQTLNSISAEKNSTVIFPLPIDLITNLLHGEKPGEDKETFISNQCNY